MKSVLPPLLVCATSLCGQAAVLIDPIAPTTLDYPDLDLIIVGTNQAGTGPDPIGQGANYGAVGSITIDSIFGSGVLISPSVMLTAAHVVEGYAGTGTVEFSTPGGFVTRSISSVTIHPLWTSLVGGNLNYDLAYISLNADVTTATPYELYTSTDEAGKSTVMVGYGRTNTNGPGTKRMGVNEVDATYTFVPPGLLNLNPSGSILVSDFDSDGSDFTTWSGDSGGPLLIGGKVAGIASWTSDSTPTYSDYFGHVRVSSFISSGGFLSAFVPVTSAVPEPATLTYGLMAFVALRWNRRRQTSAGHISADGRGRAKRPRRRRRSHLDF